MAGEAERAAELTNMARLALHYAPLPKCFGHVKYLLSEALEDTLFQSLVAQVRLLFDSHQRAEGEVEGKRMGRR